MYSQMLNLIQRLELAGTLDNDPMQLQLRRLRFVNKTSLYACGLVFVFGGMLAVLSGKYAILIPAIPETLCFALVIWLNHNRRYRAAIWLWHLTFCSATLIFGIMFSSVIDAAYMLIFLVATPLLVLRSSDFARTMIVMVMCAGFAVGGIMVNNFTHWIEPMHIEPSLHWIFHIATVFTLLFLNLVVFVTFRKDLDFLIGALLNSNQQLAKESYLKSLYVSETTHDLNETLIALKDISILLDDPSIDPAAISNLKEGIRVSAAHALEVVNNVRELSRIEKGEPIEPRYEPVEVLPWIRGATSLFKLKAQKRGINLHYEIDPSIPPQLQMDKTMVHRILNNLLSNAIKFTARNKSVVVRIRCDSSTWQLSISDGGPGMTADQQLRIFDLHYTDKRDNPTGQGIGLFVAKKFVDAMGAKITIKSELGSGTTFSIGFPMLPLSGEVNIQLTALHLKVLIIDDDVRMAYRQLKKPLEGLECSCKIATGATETLRILAYWRPDVILLDRQLEDTTGLAFFDLLRSSELYGSIPIIIVSAGIFDEEAQSLCDKGAKGYLQKPIKLAELHDLLHSLNNTNTSRKEGIPA